MDKIYIHTVVKVQGVPENYKNYYESINKLKDKNKSTIFDVKQTTKLFDVNQIKVLINQLVNPTIKADRNSSNLLEESPVANTSEDNDLQSEDSDHAGLKT